MSLPDKIETKIEDEVAHHNGSIEDDDERLDAALVSARGIADEIDSLATMGAVIGHGEQVDTVGKGNTVFKTMHQAALDTIKNEIDSRLGAGQK